MTHTVDENTVVDTINKYRQGNLDKETSFNTVMDKNDNPFKDLVSNDEVVEVVNEYRTVEKEQKVKKKLIEKAVAINTLNDNFARRLESDKTENN